MLSFRISAIHIICLLQKYVLHTFCLHVSVFHLTCPSDSSFTHVHASFTDSSKNFSPNMSPNQQPNNQSLTSHSNAPSLHISFFFVLTDDTNERRTLQSLGRLSTIQQSPREKQQQQQTYFLHSVLVRLKRLIKGVRRKGTRCFR